MNQEKDLLSAVRELVDAHFSDLRRTVRKNLARLTCAFLHLAWSIRFGYGGLHLTSIARVLPEGKLKRLLPQPPYRDCGSAPPDCRFDCRPHPFPRRSRRRWSAAAIPWPQACIAAKQFRTRTQGSCKCWPSVHNVSRQGRLVRATTKPWSFQFLPMAELVACWKHFISQHRVKANRNYHS